MEDLIDDPVLTVLGVDRVLEPVKVEWVGVHPLGQVGLFAIQCLDIPIDLCPTQRLIRRSSMGSVDAIPPVGIQRSAE
jgi:hypothetical protein